MTRTILWTGGFDSTYLVVDALLAGDTVAAITWTDSGRLRVPVAKANNEAEARARIVDLLPAELLPRLSAETFSDRQVDAHDLPLLRRRKRTLYADAQARGFAGILDATWTCEWVGYDAMACGKCKACKLRARSTKIAA